MRILLAALVASTALIGATAARAADFPDYPEIEIPEVDYGVGGSFYLRGSAGGNYLWTYHHIDITGTDVGPSAEAGYGYSIGAGFGYEFGDGLRVDVTGDYLSNDGLADADGNTLHLRSTVLLANAYYDFPLSDVGSLGGGFGAYVGGGFGAAYNQTSVTPADTDLPDGTSWGAAAAAMAGVSYDAGDWVADLGYRLIYLPTITNNNEGAPSYYLNGNTVHEVRGTVRYRFQ